MDLSELTQRMFYLATRKDSTNLCQINAENRQNIKIYFLFTDILYIHGKGWNVEIIPNTYLVLIVEPVVPTEIYVHGSRIFMCQ